MRISGCVTLEFKTTKFNVFNGEEDPREHLIKFKEEYLFKI